MKVAIVSAGSPDYLELANVTQPTRARYAEKHGYDAYYFETTRERGDACKYDAFKHLDGKGYDVMVWMDLDSMVMNSAISIEKICQYEMGYEPDMMHADARGHMTTGPGWFTTAHFLWSYDHAGPNSGVYIVRFTSEGRLWMDRAYATMLENGLADETAMEILATTHPFKDWVRACPGTVLNSYDASWYYGDRYTHEVNQYQPGNFIIHYPGYPNEKRIPELRRRLAEAT